MEMASDIGRIPTVASGSETTYECDGLWFNNTIVAVALFGGNRSNGSKCGLSYWNVNNPATNVNTNIVASQSYQIMEHLTKSTPFSYTAGC